MKLHLDASKGFYGSCVGLNMYPLATSECTVVFNYIFLQHQSTIQQSKYLLLVGLRQFCEHQLISLVIKAEV